MNNNTNMMDSMNMMDKTIKNLKTIKTIKDVKTIKDIEEQFSCLVEINKKIIRKIETARHLNEIKDILESIPYMVYFPFNEKQPLNFAPKSYSNISQFENIITVASLYHRVDILDYILNYINVNKCNAFDIENIIVSNFNHFLRNHNARGIKCFLQYDFLVKILQKFNLDLLTNCIDYDHIEGFSYLIKNSFIKNDEELKDIIDEICAVDAYEMKEIIEEQFQIEIQ